MICRFFIIPLLIVYEYQVLLEQAEKAKNKVISSEMAVDEQILARRRKENYRLLKLGNYVKK